MNEKKLNFGFHEEQKKGLWNIPIIRSFQNGVFGCLWVRLISLILIFFAGWFFTSDTFSWKGKHHWFVSDFFNNVRLSIKWFPFSRQKCKQKVPKLVCKSYTRVLKWSYQGVVRLALADLEKWDKAFYVKSYILCI